MAYGKKAPSCEPLTSSNFNAIFEFLRQFASGYPCCTTFQNSVDSFEIVHKYQWCNRRGWGQGAECLPDTSDWEISVDLYREKRPEARKKGEWIRKGGKLKKGRWKTENGGGKVTK